MEGNYIKLYRSFFDWEWYGNINTCRVFIHMLLKANWKNGKFEGKVIPRGSFVSSIPKLSDELSLTEREVRTAITHLKSTGELTVKTTNRYSVFTVKKYCQYQTIDTQNDSQAPDKRQSIDSLTTTIEEKKEGKNILPPISPSRFNDFWEHYPKKVHMLIAETAYNQVLFDDPDIAEDDLVQSAVNYGEAARILEKQEQFVLNPENYLRKGAFVDYLPGKYRKPEKLKSQTSAGQFNQYMRSDYDFSKIEEELGIT